MLTTDSPCDVNTMMMVNRKMLDAHKKMVESKLQMEVAHSVTCMSHPAPAPPACHGATCGQHTCPAAAPHCLVRTPLKSQGSKRFFPHLEQIPEESRNNTARSVTNKKAQVHTCKQCWRRCLLVFIETDLCLPIFWPVIVVLCPNIRWTQSEERRHK